MPSETSKSYLERLLIASLEELEMSEQQSVKPEISAPDARFGDYATNIGLILAKKLKLPPMEVAGKISETIKLLDTEKVFADVSAAGGFINFTLSQNSLAEFALVSAGKAKVEQLGNGKKVVFEYSSPNTNKPLHIGHTRNDVYGLACVCLLKAVGYNVVTCEIINDRGIHIMKSMLMYQKYGKGQTPESETTKPDHFVGKFYQMFAKENGKYLDEKNPDFIKKLKSGESVPTMPQIDQTPLMIEAQNLLVKWESGDAEVRALWKQMNDWWYQGVKETYEKEGSYFDEVDHESNIYDKGRDIVLEGVKQGVFGREADGSVFVDLTGSGLDKKYLLRKDGTTIYITQDMYLWHLRNEKHHPELAFVTTSSEQSYHFKVLKLIFEKLDLPWAHTFRHLPYEHVYLGQNKMSSRAGNTISADELLQTIKDKVKTAMRALEKIKQTTENEKLVEQVAFGAIKYGYLKYEPNTRIYFDIDQTISLEGNTGPYIQYAYSRIRSILKKAVEVKAVKPNDLTIPEERQLMRQLLYYSGAVGMAAQDFKPNLLCNYLYELAGKFSAFYNAVSVLNADSPELKQQRLTLLLAVANVLKDGLGILGIEAPEEM